MTIQKIQTGVIEDNAITTSKVLDGSVTPEKLATSGTLPALDGSQLINIQAGSTEIIDSADDPAIDTNPADGVGALWANITTGCLFCCTDATTDLNVWTMVTVCTDSIGGGGGDAWLFGGTEGIQPNSTSTNELTYISLTSDSQQNVGSGDVNGPTPQGSVSCNSATTSYLMGVHTGASILDVTVKFAFASATNSASPTSVISTGQGSGGAFLSDSIVNSMSTDVNGYVGGGRNNVGIALQSRAIRRISFASEAVTANIGTIASTVFGLRAAQNSIGGLFMGGRFTDGNNNGQNRVTNIDKFTFASESNQVNFDDLITATENGTATSTNTHAYLYGGVSGGGGGASPPITIMSKIAFASAGSEVSHGDLRVTITSDHPAQSITHGYSIGGFTSTGQVSSITQYSFANENSAVLATNMTRARGNGATVSQVPTIISF